ncbi:LLM class F420-dependent oxidoreductase [Actinomadura rugatobispora]|uniref:LLM class F420-dependent oxidoreductase n=1 Tax=Actinomadura rugatobispora TaxID=1994 RepID=A0ABW1ADN7_9ACTN|nr:TIGR03564 family F420-dependent LLM class oxidoreductase [Actinomadura rugatobispora]
MRIGRFVGGGGATLEELVGEIREAAEAGLDSAFLSQLTDWDAITVAGIAGRDVPGIEVGTGIVPTYPRHPVALAGQALTAQVLSGGRFTLGVGPSHPPLIEDRLGYSYARPLRHTREYLTALLPLLNGQEVDYRGETITAVAKVSVPGAAPPPVLLAALGPKMLRLAGELAGGTITTWVGAEATGDHIVPAITKAAEEAGRPAPRIVSSVIIELTGDPDGARRSLAGELGFASDFPAYRAILDRQGLDGVQETIVAGDERAVTAAIRRFADAGTTDLLVSPRGDAAARARVIELAGSLRRGA